MERRINKKIENYISEFKDNIRNKTCELGISSLPELKPLIQYICDYDRLTLDKEDFMKRKRVKNVVHLTNRCCAKRANNEQCTRRRKNDSVEYCGTHLKGTPHGVCDLNTGIKQQGQKVEVWAQDIKGIIYYIDNNNNVYKIEDIMQSKQNPEVIAKYIRVGETYMIPEFDI